MAERRMFSNRIIDSDDFLDLPDTTKVLYFYLNMKADDDGFISNPRGIMRLLGAKQDDMKLLISKQFIIAFQSGVVVIKDWRIHNYIRNDRKKNTTHLEEQKLISLEDNGSYTLNNDCLPNDNQMTTDCLPSGSIGKDRIGKDRIGKSNIVKGDDDEMTTPTPYQNCIGYWQQQVNANANTITIDTLKEWVVKFGEQGDDIVKYGIDVMLYNGASRLGYLEAILKEWYGVHVDTVDKAKAYSEQRKQQQQQRNGNQQPVYHVEDYRKELYGE